MPEPIPNRDCICYADVITIQLQIHCAANTTRHPTTKQLRSKMKDTKTLRPIQNNIHIQHRIETIKIYDEERDKYETKDIVVGLNISTHEVTQQIKKRKAIAGEINKLCILKIISSKIKMKFYNAIVRTILIYPILPLHAQSSSQLLHLQRV